MLLATVLALSAAVMHAGWNLVVKQTPGDRYVAIWGQFSIVAPVMVLALVLWPPHAAVWPWAAFSGLLHIPYALGLARGYEHGDFSLVYPIARGAGAALGAVGGVVLLGDHLGPLGFVAIGVVCAGLVGLPSRRTGVAVQSALLVAVTIAGYTLADARGIRHEGSWRYIPASSVAGCIAYTVWGISTGRSSLMRVALVTRWRPLLGVGIAATATYSAVQYAMKLAPVGYVSALRESSVVLAALVGSRMLGEDAGRRRVVCSAIVALGLALLIAAR